MSKELELIADVALDYAGASPNQLAAHVVSRLSEHGYSIVNPEGLFAAFAAANAAAKEAPTVDDKPRPPVTKYKLTVQVYGNSHEEIESELGYLLHGGYLLDSDYYKRDEFTVFGGRRNAKLEHTNPDQTPEAYREQLRAWSHRPRPAAEDDQ